MSPIPRKPRPLARDADSLRDDRLFIVACDDTYAPKQYFDFFKTTRVKVHVVPTEDGTSAAEHVLERLRNIEHEDDDELWMLLDTDHYIQGTHLASFMAALAAAGQLGVNVALSRPCFELWMLLHHEEETAVLPLGSAIDVENALRERLGQYNKTNLKQEHFPLESVSSACLRAERLDSAVAGGQIPGGNTSRVYLLWKAIVAKALPTQLPDELRALVL
jgi:hypothetical protein